MANGNVEYTTKELLARIEAKVDKIDEKLDTKADRDRVHELANLITSAEGRLMEANLSLDRRTSAIEATYVKREGPIIEELRNFEDEVRLLRNGLGQRITDELRRNAERMQEQGDRMFSRREKRFAMVVASIAALGTVISVFVLLLQLNWGGS